MTEAVDNVRERLRRAALELVAAHGFEATSYQDLARAVGVTKAAVYYHYRSKDDLLAELVDPLVVDLEALLRRAEGGRLAAGPRALLEGYLGLLLGHRPLVALVVQDAAVVNHPAVGRRLAEQHRRLQALLVGPGADAAAEARAAAAVGALRRPLLVLPEADFSRLRDVLVDAAARALGPVATPGAPTEGGSPSGPAEEVALRAAATFAAEPQSAAAARRFVAATLAGWRLEEATDVVALLTNELVTNSVRHADTDVRVALCLRGERLRVEVADDDERLPAPNLAQGTSASGRGLVLVDTLAAAWGMERHGGKRKAVWFEVVVG